MSKDREEILIEKIKSLSPERMAEAEDFIDFLREREQRSQSGCIAEQRPEQKLKQRLLELGLLKEIKLPITDYTPYQNRKPIEVTGKPLSEVILEERR